MMAMPNRCPMGCGEVCHDRWHDDGIRGFAAPRKAFRVDSEFGTMTAYACGTCGCRTFSGFDESRIIDWWDVPLLNRVWEEVDAWWYRCREKARFLH